MTGSWKFRNLSIPVDYVGDLELTVSSAFRVPATRSTHGLYLHLRSLHTNTRASLHVHISKALCNRVIIQKHRAIDAFAISTPHRSTPRRLVCHAITRATIDRQQTRAEHVDESVGSSCDGIRNISRLYIYSKKIIQIIRTHSKKFESRGMWFEAYSFWKFW